MLGKQRQEQEIWSTKKQHVVRERRIFADFFDKQKSWRIVYNAREIRYKNLSARVVEPAVQYFPRCCNLV